MKSSAGIVTIARGGCIDTDALVNALQSGEITFAGLDVTEPEPLPTGHPLWSMPNVVITPHSSGTMPCELRLISSITSPPTRHRETDRETQRDRERDRERPSDLHVQGLSCARLPF
jgi:phosphoglycerate dehydrogenase-like enzyme